MKISFNTQDGRFSYNVAAVIVHDGKILLSRNEIFPAYYLPSCRVDMTERAEESLLTELKQSLSLDNDVELVRPLWFSEGLQKNAFHDLTLYLQVDVSQTNLLERGSAFRQVDEDGWTDYAWLPFDQLKQVDLYPEFLKEIKELPQEFSFIRE